MKCLPQTKLNQAKGMVLHDQHAEVLAVRAFNRFLLDQCHDLLSTETQSSKYVRRRDLREIREHRPQFFELVDEISIYLYCSEAPCGDASMELIMQAQEDATPWDRPNSTTNLDSDGADGLLGRGCFSRLGAVRRKPARPDAPIASSKSCTDKIAMYQGVSLLRSLTSMILLPERCYLTGIVLPESQFVTAACDRAFGVDGRFKQIISTVTNGWNGGYLFRPFKVLTTKHEFKFSRRAWPSHVQMSASTISAIWTRSWQETLINGVLQGRKAGDSRGASKLCKKSMWTAATSIAQLSENATLEAEPSYDTYAKIKASQRLQDRREVKAQIIELALCRWPRTTEDSNFSLNDV